jgi:chorismate mutase
VPDEGTPKDGSGGGPAPEGDRSAGGDAGPDPRMAIERIRREIDALDRQIVGLLNQRAQLGRDVGREKAAAGWKAAADPEREREVLLRVTIANEGPIPQEDLLAIYRRLIDATRALEDRDLEERP